MHYSLYRQALIMCLIGMISFLCLSCIVIDDGHDENDLERVNYYNNTYYLVDCYIDDHYQGTVKPDEMLSVMGDYEGRHLYYSESRGNDWEWGPDYFSLADGETLNISLDPPY